MGGAFRAPGGRAGGVAPGRMLGATAVGALVSGPPAPEVRRPLWPRFYLIYPRTSGYPQSHLRGRPRGFPAMPALGPTGVPLTWGGGSPMASLVASRFSPEPRPLLKVTLRNRSHAQTCPTFYPKFTLRASVEGPECPVAEPRRWAGGEDSATCPSPGSHPSACDGRCPVLMGPGHWGLPVQVLRGPCEACGGA